MAEFTGVSAAAFEQPSVGHHTGADTRAESQHDEISHASGGAELHLAQGGGVGIVGGIHAESSQTAQYLGERHRRLPWEVSGALYGACVRIDAGRADTYANE